MWILIVIGVVLAVSIVLLLCLRGERRDVSALWAVPLAHRGLHSETRPENSLSAFRAAFERGYGAELDVHLTADGRAAVMHDRSLLRTAGEDADITTLSAADLQAFTLLGSGEPIPFLEDVLEAANGQVPLLIELKADGGNHAALCETVCRCLDAYDGAVALESFDPRCLRWLRRHRPALLRGQLSQNFCRSKDVHPALRLPLTSLVTNALTRPHFIAYRRDHRRSLPLFVCRRIWRLPTAWWTVADEATFARCRADGDAPIFEGFEP